MGTNVALASTALVVVTTLIDLCRRLERCLASERGGAARLEGERLDVFKFHVEIGTMHAVNRASSVSRVEKKLWRSSFADSQAVRDIEEHIFSNCIPS